MTMRRVRDHGLAAYRVSPYSCAVSPVALARIRAWPMRRWMRFSRRRLLAIPTTYSTPAASRNLKSTILAFLIKPTAYMILLRSLAAYFAFASLRERRPPSKASLLRLAGVVVAPFAAYLIYNPSLAGLWVYLVGSVEIARGYSDAMSTLGLPSGEYLRLGLLTPIRK